MAAKIQAVARPGVVWVGETLYGHLHVKNQVACEAVQLPSEWSYVNGGGWPYKLYAMPVKSWLSFGAAA